MGAAGVMMATYCIPKQSCDAYLSGWISGHHPNKAYEKVSGSACMHYQIAVIILSTLKYVTAVDITFMHYRPLLTTVMHGTAASTVRDFTTPPC